MRLGFQAKSGCPSEIGRRTLLNEAMTLFFATAAGIGLFVFALARLFG
ncbi:MAG: hypothetical protein KIT16_04575 [Rhodospirillaceae bacterium]|nr:hypothetical protein [Rhodospirillaceae bacterium]